MVGLFATVSKVPTKSERLRQERVCCLHLPHFPHRAHEIGGGDDDDVVDDDSGGGEETRKRK